MTRNTTSNETVSPSEQMDTTHRNKTPNEWKKGWKIVVSAFFISFITDGLLFSFGIMLVEIVDYFGEGRATTGATVSINVAVKHLVGPLAGALTTKFGHRIIVIIGALVSCIGFVLSSFATSVYHLWITYGFLGGLGFGLMFLSANVCVLEHFNKHRALAYGIVASGSGTGTFVINYCLLLLIDRFGWRGTMLLLAGLVLQGVIFGLLLSNWMKESVEFEEQHTTLVLRLKNCLSSMFNIELLRDMRCMMILLSTIVISFAFVVPFTFIPDQAEQAGMSKTEAAMLASSIGIANTVSRVIFGWIGDRICFSKLILVATLVFLNGLLTGISPYMETFETKLAYTSLFGTLIGGYVALFTVVLVDMINPDLTSNAFGLVQLSIGVGVIASTPIAGFLFDRTGSYTITFFVCGAEFIVGAILLFMCKLFNAPDEHKVIESTRM